MGRPLRRTALSRRAAHHILEADTPVYGFELSKVIGCAPSVARRILDRFEELGWMTSELERGFQVAFEKRAPRILFSPTALGRRELSAFAGDPVPPEVPNRSRP